jgi:cytochrome c-type biogenesis protein CcmF
MYANLAQLGLVLSIMLGFLVPFGLFWFKATAKIRFASLLNQAVLAQFICISFAFFSLGYAYVSSDFSLLNVFRNSHASMPIMYKFSGLWSNHEGSMLLWVFFLSFCNIIFMRHKFKTQDKLWMAAIQIMVTASLLSYIVLKSNPFIKISPLPEQGIGFNPLLQDIGLAIHPPILYMGYVTTSIAFVISCAALIRKQLSPYLLQTMQIWNLFSWSFLTLGVSLGSWWAYRELGWGGYWFWDPVENASLLPWLISSALIHSIYATKKLATNYRWTILLGILGFLLSILTVFLVRSGVVTSVHSFASDPNRGVFLLALLISYSSLALGLFAFRGHFLVSSTGYSWVSRFGGINFSNILWCVATLIILLSLLYPLIFAMNTGEQVSVDSGFFEKSFIPVLLGVLFFLALTLPATWHNILPLHYRHFFYSVIISSIISICFYYYSSSSPSYVSLSSFFIGLLVVIRMCFWIAIKQNPSLKFGAIWLVHLAAGLFAIIIAFLETNSHELLVNFKEEGSKVSFADFTINYERRENFAIDNYLAGKVVLSLEKDNSELGFLTPEIRFYPVEKSQTSEASVYHSIFYDLYAVINEIKQDGSLSIRLYFKPLISWIWAICLTSFVCGIFLLFLNVTKRSNAPA